MGVSPLDSTLIIFLMNYLEILCFCQVKIGIKAFPKPTISSRAYVQAQSSKSWYVLVGLLMANVLVQCLTKETWRGPFDGF